MHAFDDMTEPELRAFFNNLAGGIDSVLPPDTGFILLVAPRGENSVAQYVSNSNREDCISWMGETIARFRMGDFVKRSGS